MRDPDKRGPRADRPNVLPPQAGTERTVLIPGPARQPPPTQEMPDELPTNPRPPAFVSANGEASPFDSSPPPVSLAPNTLRVPPAFPPTAPSYIPSQSTVPLGASRPPHAEPRIAQPAAHPSYAPPSAVVSPLGGTQSVVSPYAPTQAALPPYSPSHGSVAPARHVSQPPPAQSVVPVLAPRVASAAPPFTGAILPSQPDLSTPGLHAAAHAAASPPQGAALSGVVPAASARALDERHQPSRRFRTVSTPTWVVVYIVACAALTMVGLVVLYLEHHMLGSASPL